MAQSQLPEGYCFSALHCIKICCDKEGCIEVYLDRRLQLVSEIDKGAGYRVGYVAESGGLEIGYTAVTKSTYHEQEENIILPAECGFYPVFGKVTGNRNPDGSIMLGQGENAQYSVWAGMEDTYRCYISTEGPGSGSAEVLIDNEKIGVCEGRTGLASFEVKMKQGVHTLRIQNTSGVMCINRIRFYPYNDSVAYRNELEGKELKGYGKKLTGSTWWSDYTVSAELTVSCEEQGSAGLLLRVKEPSEGGEGDDPVLGADFFIGYSVSFTGKELMIIKHRYNEEIMKSCPFPTEPGETYQLLVKMSGTEITVYVDGKKEPELSVTDEEPIENGCVGIRVKNGQMKVHRFFTEEGQR